MSTPVAPPGRGAALAAACLGLFTVFLQTTQTIGTLNAVQDDLRLAPADLVWVPSVYTLVVAALVLGAGDLADRYGRRRVFLVGLASMATGGLILTVAPDLTTVLAGQAVAGLGGALITPSSLALVTHANPDPRRRAAAIAAWAATSGIGVAVGPLIAGLALEYADWHAAFWIEPIVCAAAAVVALLGVTESRAPGGRPDRIGQFLAAATLALLVYWLIDGGHHGYTAPRPLTAGCAAAVLAALFVVIELRQHRPVLDLRLLRDPSYSAALLLAAAVLFGFVGITLLEVLWLQRARDLSALAVGVRLLAQFLPFIAASAAAGAAARRTGPRPLIIIGLVLSALGAWLFSRVSPDEPLAGHLAAMVVFGVGCGLAGAPSTALAVGHVPPGREGEAAGAVNAARQIGAILGTSILGTLMTSRLAERLPRFHDPREAFTDAVTHAGAVGATILACATAVGLALFLLPRRSPDGGPTIAAEAELTGHR